MGSGGGEPDVVVGYRAAVGQQLAAVVEHTSADLPHPWRMLGDWRIALAFAMPETPVFVATVLEHNRRRTAAEVSMAVRMVNGGITTPAAAVELLRRRLDLH